MKIFLIIFFAIAISGILFGLLMILRADVVYRNEMVIINAIYRRAVHDLDEGSWELNESTVLYDSMRNRYWCLWDWGHKHILPKDKYERIKPFIKRRKTKNAKKL